MTEVKKKVMIKYGVGVQSRVKQKQILYRT